MLQMITMICSIVCLASLVLSQLNNKKGKTQRLSTEYYDLKIDILEKTSQTLVKNYENVSDKYEKVIKENRNLIDKCSTVLEEAKIINGNNNKLLNRIKEQDIKIKQQLTEIKELKMENKRLKNDIKDLKLENRKIISALQQYDIMAPHFEIKEPFSIKAVK